MFSNQHINFIYLFVCMICFSLITYYKKYWENSLWIYRWFYFYKKMKLIVRYG